MVEVDVNFAKSTNGILLLFTIVSSLLEYGGSKVGHLNFAREYNWVKFCMLLEVETLNFPPVLNHHSLSKEKGAATALTPS